MCNHAVDREECGQRVVPKLRECLRVADVDRGDTVYVNVDVVEARFRVYKIRFLFYDSAVLVGDDGSYRANTIVASVRRLHVEKGVQHLPYPLRS